MPSLSPFSPLSLPLILSYSWRKTNGSQWPMARSSNGTAELALCLSLWSRQKKQQFHPSYSFPSSVKAPTYLSQRDAFRRPNNKEGDETAWSHTHSLEGSISLSLAISLSLLFGTLGTQQAPRSPITKPLFLSLDGCELTAKIQPSPKEPKILLRLSPLYLSLKSPRPLHAICEGRRHEGEEEGEDPTPLPCPHCSGSPSTSSSSSKPTTLTNSSEPMMTHIYHLPNYARTSTAMPTGHHRRW